MLKTMRSGWPTAPLEVIAKRSMDWWVRSEDLPTEDNRVTVTSRGRIRVRWTPTIMAMHRALVRETRRIMKRAGYPLAFLETKGIATKSHKCGSLRFGNDRGKSVLDPWIRTHDVNSLYDVDSSFFPSSAAMNPALTIAAEALRAGKRIVAES